MPPSGFMAVGFVDWTGWAAPTGEWLTGALRAFVVAWSFALGASVGSFLNVVVYRLPAGMNLSRPKSRCPRCGTPIRATDNLPVFGWLRLRGRCRACGLPIAARYPLVEALCGTALATLALTIVLMGGVNLPIDAGRAGLSSLFLRSLEPDGIALCGGLFVGAVTLLGAGLIALDGHRLPWRFVLFGLLVPAALAAVWPGLRVGAAAVWGGRPWSLAGVGEGFDLGSYRFVPNLAGPLDAATGALICGALGAVLAPLLRGRIDRLNLALIAATAGAWWGWHAGAVGLAAGGAVAFAAPMLYAAGALRTRVPPTAFVAYAAAAVPFTWGAIGLNPADDSLWGKAATIGLAAGALAAGATVDRLFFSATDPQADASADAGV
ncbi:A24 family peptidase [Alienimonas californiensis]|uniref:Leader peptidase PppA n=1 Tax=Alienimonas californiensis TaxID=2527989 RepID=A0A517PAF8_9PLAN|nr:prepilin peptidase [Alienimonas californiensis]QDT16353.1 Leader peptidase PppA [Alienimonas californiensis]